MWNRRQNRHQCGIGLLVAVVWLLPLHELQAQRGQRGPVQRGPVQGGPVQGGPVQGGQGQGGQGQGGQGQRGDFQRGGGENQGRGSFQRGEGPGREGGPGRGGDQTGGGNPRRGGQGGEGGPPGGRGERFSGRGEGAESGGNRNRDDSGRSDSGRSDSGRSDSGRSDSGRGDGGRGDGGRGDGGRGDGGRGDGGRGQRTRGRGGEEAGDEDSNREEAGREEAGREESGRRDRQRRPVVGDVREQVLNQLKALDLNQDGRLEPAEANPTSSLLMKRVGLDPGRPVYLETLQTLVNQLDLTQLEYDPESGIIVDGGNGRLEFREVRSRSRANEFSEEANAILSDPTPLEERYSYQVLAEVRSLLMRYDSNRNTVLDPEEIARVPWSEPHPAESDLDQNGVLSEVELAERLAAISGEPTSGRSRRSRGRADTSAADPEQAARRAEAEAQRQQQAAERRERERQRRSSGTTDRIDTYVRDLLQKWDADSDGSLSIEEASEMRNPPPKTADKDGDGKFSFPELYAYYGDGDSPSSSSGSSRASAGGSQNRDSRPPLPGTIRWDGAFNAGGESGLSWPSDLARKDRNGDGMISLAEFATNLDESTRVAFARWDANGDGYITLSEANKVNVSNVSGARPQASSSRSARGGGQQGRGQRGGGDQAREADSGQAATGRGGRGDVQRGRSNQGESNRGGRTDDSQSPPTNQQRPADVIRYNLGGR